MSVPQISREDMVYTIHCFSLFQRIVYNNKERACAQALHSKLCTAQIEQARPNLLDDVAYKLEATVHPAFYVGEDSIDMGSKHQYI